jgi:hypothetical protein
MCDDNDIPYNVQRDPYEFKELEEYFQRIPKHQKKEWIELTDEEFDKIYLNSSNSIEMLKEVTAQLKEKNNL